MVKKKTNKNMSSVARNVEVVEVVACSNSGPSRKTLKNRERRMKQKLKKKAGVIQSSVVPSKGLVGGANSLAYAHQVAGQVLTNEKFCLSEASKSFIMKHLNPNGEYGTKDFCGKVPDGALVQSAAVRFIQAFTVKPPNQLTNQLPLDGNTWTLISWSMPQFRYPMVLIASMENTQPTTEEISIFVQTFNNFTFVEETNEGFYPNWTSVTGTGLYFAVIKWKALEGISGPTETGFSQLVQQYRITSEGITVYNNTPTLIDQGMIVGAQFNSNYDHINSPTTVDDAGFIGGTFLFSRRVSPTLPLEMQFSMPGLSITAVGAVFGSLSSGSFVLNNNVNFISAGVNAAAGDALTWNQTATNLTLTHVVSGTQLLNIVLNSNGLWAVTFLNIKIGLSGELGIELSPKVNVVQVPAFDIENLMQASPKTVVLTMKEDNGGYMVKRLFQPVFNMTDASTFAPVRFNFSTTTKDELYGATNNLQDTFDKNFSVGVIAMTAIPTSCNPFIKIQRHIEVIAPPDSPWMPFMEVCPRMQEEVSTIIRTFAEEHPFMYPESYNIMDKLFGMVMGAIESIPLVGATLPAIKGIISKLVGGANSGKKPNGDDAIEMFEKLLQAIKNVRT